MGIAFAPEWGTDSRPSARRWSRTYSPPDFEFETYSRPILANDEQQRIRTGDAFQVEAEELLVSDVDVHDAVIVVHDDCLRRGVRKPSELRPTDSPAVLG